MPRCWLFHRGAYLGFALALAPVLTGCTRGSTQPPAATASPAPPSPPAGSAAAPAIPQFRDAAASLGIRFTYDHGGSGRYYYTEIAGGGGALFDYDGDGWLDVYLVQGAALPGYKGNASFRNRLYRNLGNGRGFEDVTTRAGVDGVRSGRKVYGIGCAVGDYDNDGHPDLCVTGFEGSILYHNKGDGTFTDVTRASGVRDTHFGSSAAFVDYDRDGRLDLLLCEYVKYRLDDDIQCVDPKRQQPDYCRPDFFPATQSRLYHNLGNGRFRDVTAAAGLTSGYGKALGVVAGDVDDDGDPDIYLTCDLTPNLLYINQGNGTFKEEAVSRGCALGTNSVAQAGMGVDLGDVDGDLQPDLLVTNYWMESNNLYRNLGGGVFMDVGATAGVGGPNRRQVSFGTGLRDFNNDGWPDLFITNGHVLVRTEGTTPGADRAQTDQLFLNAGRGQFREVSQEAGPWFKQPHVGRGAAFGDIDNDGDLDILLVPNEGPAALLINEGGNRGHWLRFRLRGRRSNRDGIGARIDVTVDGRVIRDEVRSAYSYCSASELDAHFGLGASPRASKVVIHWPSGQIDTLTNVAADRVYTVREGDASQQSSQRSP